MLAGTQYLQQHPPKKQVLDNGHVRWVDRQGTSGSAIGDVLLSVRTVRNNVFHGGKFPDGMITDPLRDEQLIRDCLQVLSGLLNIAIAEGRGREFQAVERRGDGRCSRLAYASPRGCDTRAAHRADFPNIAPFSRGLNEE